jgi:hypothetical protein
VAEKDNIGAEVPREALVLARTIDRDQEAAGKFFSDVCDCFPCKEGTSVIIVTHILRDRPVLLAALGRHARLQLVLAKPRSIHAPTLVSIRQRPPCEARWT